MRSWPATLPATLLIPNEHAVPQAGTASNTVRNARWAAAGVPTHAPAGRWNAGVCLTKAVQANRAHALLLILYNDSPPRQIYRVILDYGRFHLLLGRRRCNCDTLIRTDHNGRRHLLWGFAAPLNIQGSWTRNIYLFHNARVTANSWPVIFVACSALRK